MPSVVSFGLLDQQMIHYTCEFYLDNLTGNLEEGL